MRKLRVATIGCGSIAQELHLPGYAKNPHCEIVACADPEPRRWSEVEKQFGVRRFYEDYRTMLDKEALDAVSVCSPNKFHAEQAYVALNLGLHVICEKPMTLTIKEADVLAKAVEKTGAVFMVGFSHRFIRGNIEARKILKSGSVGKPFMIRIRFAHQGPYPGWAKDDWFYSPKVAGGGALLDMGIHAFDLVRFFLGDVKTVSANVKTIFKHIKVDDNAVIMLEFESGALGYIEVGWTSLPGFIGSEIYCRDGNIFIDYRNAMTLLTGIASPSGRSKTRVKTFPFKPTEGGWDIEMDYFVNCILKGKKPEPDVYEGREAVRIALAAYESARTGRTVTIG